MEEEGIIMHMVINGVIQFHFNINSQEENRNARWLSLEIYLRNRIVYFVLATSCKKKGK